MTGHLTGPAPRRGDIDAMAQRRDGEQLRQTQYRGISENAGEDFAKRDFLQLILVEECLF